MCSAKLFQALLDYRCYIAFTNHGPFCFLTYCTYTHTNHFWPPHLSPLFVITTYVSHFFCLYLRLPLFCICLPHSIIANVQASYKLMKGWLKKKLLTTIKILSDFKSTTSSKCSIQSGVIQTCKLSVKHKSLHVTGHISKVKCGLKKVEVKSVWLEWLEVSLVKLTFPLNGFQQSGQHGWSSLWKGKLLRQVQQTEAWRR